MSEPFDINLEKEIFVSTESNEEVAPSKNEELLNNESTEEVVPSKNEELFKNESTGEVAKNEELLNNIDKLFSDMPKKLFSFTLMDEIAGKNFAIGEDKISFSTFCRGADCLVTACTEVDIRVRERYLNVLKRLFFMVDEFNDAMRYVYQLDYFRNCVGYVPNLRDYYKDFDWDMSKILNSLTEYNTFSVNPNIANIERSLAFLLMISPKPAIRQVLVFYVNSKPLWPSASLILEKIPAFFELRAYPLSPDSEEKELLIISLFRRLLNVEKAVISMTNEAHRNILESLVLTFTRTQYRVSKDNSSKEVAKYPLVNATEFVCDFLVDHLSKDIHVEFLLRVLNKTLQIQGDKFWDIKWAQNGKEDANVRTIDPSVLILLVIDICVKYSDKPEIQSLAPLVIKSLSVKLRADNVVLSKLDQIVDKMNDFDWCLKYCVCRWLEISKEQLNFQYQIPSVLYKAISQEKRREFSPIESAVDSGETEDFIRSLFELSMLSPEEAVAFISENKITTLPIKVFSPMLAEGLLRSLRSDTSVDTLLKICPLIDALLTLLDVPVKQRCGNFWTERMFEGMRALAPTSVLFDALYIYIKENLKEEEEFLNTDELRPEAKVLLETYSSSVQCYIKQELSKLKTASITFQTNEFGSMVETELVSALNQLAILFVSISFLAEKLQPISPHLKRLQVELSQLSKMLNNKVFPPYCEDISRYSKPGAISVVQASSPAEDADKKRADNNVAPSEAVTGSSSEASKVVPEADKVAMPNAEANETGRKKSKGKNERKNQNAKSRGKNAQVHGDRAGRNAPEHVPDGVFIVDESQNDTIHQAEEYNNPGNARGGKKSGRNSSRKRGNFHHDHGENRNSSPPGHFGDLGRQHDAPPPPSTTQREMPVRRYESNSYEGANARDNTSHVMRQRNVRYPKTNTYNRNEMNSFAGSAPGSRSFGDSYRGRPSDRGSFFRKPKAERNEND